MVLLQRRLLLSRLSLCLHRFELGKHVSSHQHWWNVSIITTRLLIDIQILRNPEPDTQTTM